MGFVSNVNRKHPNALAEALKYALSAWLLGRLLLLGLSLLLGALGLLPLPAPIAGLYHGETPLLATDWVSVALGAWQRWDAIHYARLATHGYHAADLTLFFPVYAFLGRGLSQLTGLVPLAALLLVSDLACIGALALLYDLAKAHLTPTVARWLPLSTVLTPFAFFLFAPYADGLALFFILLAYWAAQRSRWGVVGLAGLCAGLTRPTVLPLIPALLWLAYQAPVQHGWQRLLKFGAALGPAVGTGIFLLWRAYMGFGGYVVEQGGGGWGIHWPGESLLYLPTVWQSSLFWLVGWLNVSVLLFTGFSLWAWRKRWPPALWLYQFANLFFLLAVDKLADPLSNFGRHSLLTFPLFILLTSLWPTTRWRFVSWVLLGLLELSLATMFFLWLPI